MSCGRSPHIASTATQDFVTTKGSEASGESSPAQDGAVSCGEPTKGVL